MNAMMGLSTISAKLAELAPVGWRGIRLGRRLGRIIRLVARGPLVYYTTIEDICATISSFLLRIMSPILGVVLLAVGAWGFLTWATAGANEGQVMKAKKILKNGGIGVGGFLLLSVIVGIFLDIISEAGGGTIDNPFEGGGGGG